ncbi:MAG: hypothetical protein C3F07_13285 [Anaerolineales bacterium]|nr:MAG: hypothetical protein C3F07_13285 [Anaerolineales bacterium]
MRSSRLRFILLLLFTVGLVFVFIYYLYVNRDKYLQLINVSPSSVFLLLVLSVIFPVINGQINALLFQGMGVRQFPYQDGFLLAAISSLANQLPISGGIVSKAFYLKYKYNLSYTKFASATLALFICFVAVNGLIGTMILLYWIMIANVVVSPLLLGGFIVMSAFLLLLWIPIDRINIPGSIRKWTRQAIDGWLLISENPLLVIKLVGLQTCLMTLLAIRYWIAFHMLSQAVALSEVVLFASASVLTQLASFVPGGLGIREAIVGAVASALGFDLGVSIVAVGLDRLISTIVILIAGGISTVILGKQLSDASPKSDDTT